MGFALNLSEEDFFVAKGPKERGRAYDRKRTFQTGTERSETDVSFADAKTCEKVRVPKKHALAILRLTG